MTPETRLSDALFRRFATLFYDFSGIKLKEYKKYLVEYRLMKFVGEGKNFPDFESYYRALIGDKSGQIRRSFVQVLTTNYTFFFREKVHFDFLRDFLSTRVATDSPVRLWSAASSTGEEAYSMAITAREALPKIDKTDFKILATDISVPVLRFADRGLFHFSKIKGNIEDLLLRKYFYFNKDEKTFKVKESVKKLIAFRFLNLMEDYPFKKNFDVVFLRNVLIYFDMEEREFVINKIYDHIKQGGYLIMGLSESLVGIRHSYKVGRNSIYKKI